MTSSCNAAKIGTQLENIAEVQAVVRSGKAHCFLFCFVFVFVLFCFCFVLFCFLSMPIDICVHMPCALDEDSLSL